MCNPVPGLPLLILFAMCIGALAVLGMEFSLSYYEIDPENRAIMPDLPELPAAIVAAYTDALSAKRLADSTFKAKSDAEAALVAAKLADEAATVALADASAKLDAARVALDGVNDAYLRPGQ